MAACQREPCKPDGDIAIHVSHGVQADRNSVDVRAYELLTVVIAGVILVDGLNKPEVKNRIQRESPDTKFDYGLG